MGKKQEKKLKVTHCEGKETTDQAKICKDNNKINKSKIATANGRAQQEERKTEEEIQVRKARFSFKIEVLKTSTSNCPRTEISKLLAEC